MDSVLLLVGLLVGFMAVRLLWRIVSNLQFPTDLALGLAVFVLARWWLERHAGVDAAVAVWLAGAAAVALYLGRVWRRPRTACKVCGGKPRDYDGSGSFSEWCPGCGGSGKWTRPAALLLRKHRGGIRRRMGM